MYFIIKWNEYLSIIALYHHLMDVNNWKIHRISENFAKSLLYTLIGSSTLYTNSIFLKINHILFTKQ